MTRLAARLLIASLVLYATPAVGDEGRLLFEDDFESGLRQWIVSDPEYVEVVDSPDGAPGFSLQPPTAITNAKTPVARRLHRPRRHTVLLIRSSPNAGRLPEAVVRLLIVHDFRTRVSGLIPF